MGSTVVKEEMFPEIIEEYNRNGKMAAYDLIRSRYGIQNPYFVIRRIKKCGKYTYDPDMERFAEDAEKMSDSVFMDLDELCNTVSVKPQETMRTAADNRLTSMEALVHELISDRLLLLSQYITLDVSTRTVLIDKTSLATDGYVIVTH